MVCHQVNLPTSLEGFSFPIMVWLVAVTFLGRWFWLFLQLLVVFYKMITLFFSMRWHMSRLALFPSSWQLGYSSFTTRNCSFSSPFFWEFYGIIISSFICFFDGLPTWAKVFHTSSKCSLDVMQTCLWSNAGPTISTWLLARPITLAFCLFLVHFLTLLHTCIGLLHSNITHFHVANVDIPLMVYISTCFGAHPIINAPQPTIFFEISL
jgi:hypothetical protein